MVLQVKYQGNSWTFNLWKPQWSLHLSPDSCSVYTHLEFALKCQRATWYSLQWNIQVYTTNFRLHYLPLRPFSGYRSTSVNEPPTPWVNMELSVKRYSHLRLSGSRENPPKTYIHQRGAESPHTLNYSDERVPSWGLAVRECWGSHSKTAVSWALKECFDTF